MSNFFPLSRGDRWYMLAVLLFAIVSFLPWSHRIEVGGMALFGWMMAGLMVFAPAVALLRLRARAPRTPRPDEAP